VKHLYKICRLRGLLPGPMQIELLENPSGAEHFHGGYGNVFKCTYQNLEVAVKVLRVCSNSDLQKTNRVSRAVPSHALAC